MSDAVVLITGANTGLGLATVKALSTGSKTYTILLGGRNLDKAKAAVEEVRPLISNKSSIEAVQIDIEDDDSIAALAKTIEAKHGRLDVLINNAGTLLPHTNPYSIHNTNLRTGGQFDPQVTAGNLTPREMWNKSWNVNTTSTYLLTSALIPLLLKSTSPRILFITSGTSTLTGHSDPKVFVNKSPEAGWPKKMLFVPAYRASKTGMNMMMLEWERILRNDGVKVWCVSPGYLATGLGVGQEKNKEMGAVDPSVGAELVRSVLEGGHDAETGKVVHLEGVQPW